MKYSNTVLGELEVIYPNDCGNAPKKLLLKEFNIAIAINDIDFISKNIADDIIWNIIGHRRVQGKENVIYTLKQLHVSKVLELDIHNIITHGKTASSNGKIKLENKKNYAISNVYIFSSAGKNSAIKEMTSYIIELSSS